MKTYSSFVSRNTTQAPGRFKKVARQNVQTQQQHNNKQTNKTSASRKGRTRPAMISEKLSFGKKNRVTRNIKYYRSSKLQISYSHHETSQNIVGTALFLLAVSFFQMPTRKEVQRAFT